MMTAIEVAIWCVKHSVPFTFENPWTSMCWLVDRMKELQELPGVFLLGIDYCQYGGQWRKSTGIMTNVVELKVLERHCTGTMKCCSSAGQAHIVLRGCVPMGAPGFETYAGELWTKVATRYAELIRSRYVHGGLKGTPTLVPGSAPRPHGITVCRQVDIGPELANIKRWHTLFAGQ